MRRVTRNLKSEQPLPCTRTQPNKLKQRYERLETGIHLIREGNSKRLYITGGRHARRYVTLPYGRNPTEEDMQNARAIRQKFLDDALRDNARRFEAGETHGNRDWRRLSDKPRNKPVSQLHIWIQQQREGAR